ncbi:MAG: serine/threonine-protein kinase, partial [Dokdonella sp.]
SGGMGSVYRAERIDHAFSRPVAIKLLLFDAGDVRVRFAQEQRILGALDHPNIARLLDVGSDANGAPFLVMEYVEGQVLTDYLRERHIGLRACVELFLKILDAVQMAHSQLVVHRDIKPGNVLVDASGEPKLLDFGIAKLIGEQALANTRTGFGPLTPDYASPEQVRGEPIGVGSDIYSLGILLYEMLTGKLPYRVVDNRPSEIERVVCTVQPARPSTHLPIRGLPGSRRDLDAVLLKSLEKGSRQRYASCGAFADDLRRWLDGRQVVAREPSWPERSQRYIRRHGLVLSAVAAVVVALLVGSGLALWQAHVAGLERDRAESVNTFLTDMLAAANPINLGRKATLRDVLDRAQRLAEHQLDDDPKTATTALLTLAKTYHALGESDAARHSANTALSAALRAGDVLQATESRIELGEILSQGGDIKTALPLLQQARADALVGHDTSQKVHAAIALGSLESQRDDAKLAQHWFEIALDEVDPAEIDTRSVVLNNLAIARDAQGDQAGALRLQLEVVAMLQVAYPHGHPNLARGLANLANAYEIAGRFDDAAATYAQALPMQIDLFGENHPDVVQTLSSMTNLDLRRNDNAAALADGTRAWTLAKPLAADHPITAYAAVMYAQALCASGRGREALPLIEHALVARKSALPADHPLIANTESLLGLATAQSGDLANGARIARAAWEKLRIKRGETSELTVAAKTRFAQIQAMPSSVVDAVNEHH